METKKINKICSSKILFLKILAGPFARLREDLFSIYKTYVLQLKPYLGSINVIRKCNFTAFLRFHWKRTLDDFVASHNSVLLGVPVVVLDKTSVRQYVILVWVNGLAFWDKCAEPLCEWEWLISGCFTF